MSADNFDSRYALGPNVFSRINPDRIVQLQTNVYMRMKVLAAEISDMDPHDEVVHEMHQSFCNLLNMNKYPGQPSFIDVSTKLHNIENFQDTDLVEDFQVLLYDRLASDEWTPDEILCVHCIEAGTFSLSELKRICV